MEGSAEEAQAATCWPFPYEEPNTRSIFIIKNIVNKYKRKYFIYMGSFELFKTPTSLFWAALWRETEEKGLKWRTS